MGQFSYFTQDTDRRIIIGNHPEITMIDDKGNKFVETACSYEGYGDFGGKDFYELLAEMNGKVTRDEGIDIAFAKDNKDYKYPNLVANPDTWEYVNELPENDPDQGFSDSEIYGDDDDCENDW